MTTAKLFHIAAMSKPQTKKDVSREYRMAFVMPHQMPEGFSEARVKGTGKPANLPAGMSLVWSITHNGWRTFNMNSLLQMDVQDFDVDSFDKVCEGHHAALAALTAEQQAPWNLIKP